MIGVVGTSRGGLVENRTAKERVAEALSLALSQIQIQAADVPITIVSGGGLVPNYAFDWARKNGHKRLQVVSAAVKSTPKGVERLEIGTSFGDESEQFVGMCQHFVRVGGGPQSHREVQLFRERNPTGVVVEVEIPLKSETAPPTPAAEAETGGDGLVQPCAVAAAAAATASDEQKQLRKLQQQMRDVERLKELHARGTPLEPTQLRKLEGEAELREKLAQAETGGDGLQPIAVEREAEQKAAVEKVGEQVDGGGETLAAAPERSRARP